MPPKDKKEKPEGWNLDSLEGFVLIILAMAILGSIIPALFSYISSGQFYFYNIKLSSIFNFFKSKVWFFKTISLVFASLAALATIILNKKGDCIWSEQKAKMYPSPDSENLSSTAPANDFRDKWKKIVDYSESENPSEWRIAIIEADIILDDLLSRLNLTGETMGEKLKAVEKSDFLSLDDAWEAHKMRNNIAHQGGDFLLNQRDVRHTISLYEKVFKEFSLI